MRLLPFNPGSNVDLLKMLQWLVDEADTAGRKIPALCDVNIWYRLC